MEGEWNADSANREWAQERWVVNKFRQVELTDDPAQRREYEGEASRKQRNWNVPDVDLLPGYPEVDEPSQDSIESVPSVGNGTRPTKVSQRKKTSEAQELPAVEVEVGGLTFECKPLYEVRRLEIQNCKTKDRVVLFGDEEEARSVSMQVTPQRTTDGEQKVWLINDWNIRCIFEPAADGHTLIQLEDATSGKPLLPEFRAFRV